MGHSYVGHSSLQRGDTILPRVEVKYGQAFDKRPDARDFFAGPTSYHSSSVQSYWYYSTLRMSQKKSVGLPEGGSLGPGARVFLHQP